LNNYEEIDWYKELFDKIITSKYMRKKKNSKKFKLRKTVDNEKYFF